MPTPTVQPPVPVSVRVLSVLVGVVAVLAAVGDMVEAGQPIVTLEAMKMEHVHAAPVAGKLTALHVSNGEQVAASRVVAEIEVVVAAPA